MACFTHNHCAIKLSWLHTGFWYTGCDTLCPLAIEKCCNKSWSSHPSIKPTPVNSLPIHNKLGCYSCCLSPLRRCTKCENCHTWLSRLRYRLCVYISLRKYIWEISFLHNTSLRYSSRAAVVTCQIKVFQPAWHHTPSQSESCGLMQYQQITKNPRAAPS